MAQSLTEQVLLLREFGLGLKEIALSIYGISEREWRKLSKRERDRFLSRVNALLYKARRYSRDSSGVIAKAGYSEEELWIDESGGVRNLDQWSPEQDGTLSIVERKKTALSDQEKYMMEYERLLYFIYDRTFSEIDDFARSIWNRVKLTHNYLFEKYWDRTHRKLVFNKTSRTRVPEVAAAYTYIVFFAALYNTSFFFSYRTRLLELIDNFVRDRGVFRKKVEELLPLIKDFII